jgi:hypothetical protein
MPPEDGCEWGRISQVVLYNLPLWKAATWNLLSGGQRAKTEREISFLILIPVESVSVLSFLLMSRQRCLGCYVYMAYIKLSVKVFRVIGSGSGVSVQRNSVSLVVCYFIQIIRYVFRLYDHLQAELYTSEIYMWRIIRIK